MGEEMGMTNKQFQGFVRMIQMLNKLIYNETDENKRKELEQEYNDILQSMLEDT